MQRVEREQSSDHRAAHIALVIRRRRKNSTIELSTWIAKAYQVMAPGFLSEDLAIEHVREPGKVDAKLLAWPPSNAQTTLAISSLTERAD